MKKVVYVNNSEKPSSDSREILFSVSDDENVSSTVTQKSIAITAVNDKPVIDLDGSGTLHKGGDSAANFIAGVHTSGVKLAPNASITDDDSSQFSKLVITLTNPLAVTDNIKPSDNASSIATTAGLTFVSSVNDSVLTVNGVASASTYEQLLQNIVFKSAVDSSSANSAFADRTV